MSASLTNSLVHSSSLKRICLSAEEREQRAGVLRAINNRLYAIQTRSGSYLFNKLAQNLFTLIVSYGNFTDFIAWRKVARFTRNTLKFEHLNSNLLRSFYETIGLQMMSCLPPKIQEFQWSILNPGIPYEMLYSKTGRTIGVKSLLNNVPIINGQSYLNSMPFYSTENGYQFIDFSSKMLMHYNIESSSFTQTSFVPSSPENFDREFELLTSPSYVIMHEERNCLYTLNVLDQEKCAILHCWNFSVGICSKGWEVRIEDVVNADNISFFKIGTHVFLRKLNQTSELLKQASIFHIDNGLHPFEDKQLGENERDQLVLKVIFASDLFTANATHFFGYYREVDGSWWIGGVELLQNSSLQFNFSKRYKLTLLGFAEKVNIQIKASNKIVCVHHSLDSKNYTTSILDAGSLTLKHSLPNRENHIRCRENIVITTTNNGNVRNLELYHTRTQQKIKIVLSNPIIDLNFSLSCQPKLKQEITFVSKIARSLFTNNLQVEVFSSQ